MQRISLQWKKALPAAPNTPVNQHQHDADMLLSPDGKNGHAAFSKRSTTFSASSPTAVQNDSRWFSTKKPSATDQDYTPESDDTPPLDTPMSPRTPRSPAAALVARRIDFARGAVSDASANIPRMLKLAALLVLCVALLSSLAAWFAAAPVVAAIEPPSRTALPGGAPPVVSRFLAEHDDIPYWRPRQYSPGGSSKASPRFPRRAHTSAGETDAGGPAGAAPTHKAKRMNPVKRHGRALWGAAWRAAVVGLAIALWMQFA